MKKLTILFILVFIASCAPEKISADLLVKNATIYTVNKNFDTAEAYSSRFISEKCYYLYSK